MELLAPENGVGLTTSPAPNLYFFVSRPVTWPVQFTIRAPMQTVPVLEVSIPPLQRAGIHLVRVAEFRGALQPGVVYRWSISIILNPKAWSRNIVASAPISRTGPDPAIESAARAVPAPRRAAFFAQAGRWYDAVAAAAETQDLDHHTALDALMDQVGLAQAAQFDRQTLRGAR
jgi:hypothetical protein